MRRRQAISLAGCLIGFAASAGGAAAAPADPFAAYAKCAAIAGDEERLACFDGLAPAMQAAAADVRNAIAAETRAELATQRAQAFGGEEFAEENEAEGVEKLAEISAPVAEIKLMEDRRLKITLENGQIWRQDPNDKIVPSPKEGVERTVTIRRAMFGRYLMTIEPEGRTIRVKRAE